MTILHHRILAAALSLSASVACAAAEEQVVCRYTYGGETHEISAAPVASPYAVPAIQIGSYFKFRVVFQKAPADIASIKVYVYADREEGAAPLHQATYAYPPAQPRDGRWGFSGRHLVYEPMRDGELEYWCRMEGGRR